MKNSKRKTREKSASSAIVVHLPRELIDLLDAAAARNGSDRNTFIGQAVLEKLKATDA